MRFCITTPQAILENDEVDIFESLIPAGTYHTKICDTLWQMYRYRGLGSCRGEFEQRLVDRYNILQEKYASIFEFYESNKSSMTSTDTSSYNINVKSKGENMPDIPVGEGEYLSNRNESDTNATYKSGMNAEIFSKMMYDKVDPYYIFALEFESLFVEFL